jgi:hypothetical protein
MLQRKQPEHNYKTYERIIRTDARDLLTFIEAGYSEAGYTSGSRWLE